MENIRRQPYSHVNSEGFAKETYITEREAINAASRYASKNNNGFEMDWYICHLRPMHWHICRRRVPE